MIDVNMFLESIEKKIDNKANIIKKKIQMLSALSNSGNEIKLTFELDKIQRLERLKQEMIEVRDIVFIIMDKNELTQDNISSILIKYI